MGLWPPQYRLSMASMVIGKTLEEDKRKTKTGFNSFSFSVGEDEDFAGASLFCTLFLKFFFNQNQRQHLRVTTESLSE